MFSVYTSSQAVARYPRTGVGPTGVGPDTGARGSNTGHRAYTIRATPDDNDGETGECSRGPGG